MKAILTTRNISKTFVTENGETIQAVDSVSLSIHENNFIILSELEEEVMGMQR